MKKTLILFAITPFLAYTSVRGMQEEDFSKTSHFSVTIRVDFPYYPQI